MRNILECPACKSRIQVKSSSASVACPKCGSAIENPAPREHRSEKKEKPSSVIRPPRRLQSDPHYEATPPISPAVPPQPARLKQAFIPEGDVDLEIGASATAAYPQRSKVNIWAALTTAGLAIIAIGGLFYIVTSLSKSKTMSDANAANTPPTNISQSSKSKPTLDNVSNNTSQREAVKAKPALPPVDETPKFFDLADMQNVWKSVNGYLVKLEIKTPIRNRIVSGLIVDSRGWVVTSLSALRDAGEVEVTLAGKALDDNPPFRELVDLSRGIIAEDPVHDLALIAINRAQVINLADIPIKTTDNIVQATRLMIARTPPPRHQRWLAECRIDQVGSFSELPEGIQQSMEAANMKADEKTEWLIYPPRLSSNLSDELSGSPLMDNQGNVVGINTGVQSKTQTAAVPAAAILKLIDSVGDSPKLKPFPRASEMLRQKTSTSNPESTKALQSFDNIVRQLSTLVDACRRTDWTADNPAEFESMQALSKTFFAFFDWRTKESFQVEDMEQYEKRFEEIMEEMTISLEDDLDRNEFLSGKGNEFFTSLVTRENPWFIIGVKVELGQFNSPPVDGKESVAFRILGTDKHLLTIPGMEARNFRQGRRFLLIGKLSDQKPFRSSLFDGETSIPLVEIPLHFQIKLRSDR